MAGALDGLRALDMTQTIAGPYCTQLLADMGAEVIRVEDPARAPGRRLGFSPGPAPGRPAVPAFSPFFMQFNRQKKSITLDLKRAEGREVLADLVRASDIVAENLLPKTHRAFGIGYEWARELNPGIIWASISTYGRTGPDAERGGFDFLAQARGGMMSVTGEIGGRPLRSGVSIGDYLGGLHLAVGILGALHHRDKTGAGQLVDVALLDSVVSCNDGLTLWPSVLGVLPERIGNYYTIRPPGYCTYECKDGEIALGGTKGPLWARLAVAIGRPDLTPEPDPGEEAAWNAFVDEGSRALTAWAAQYTRAEARAILDAAGVPNDPVQDMGEVSDDPQLEARGMFHEFRAPHLGTIRAAVTPVRLSATPTTYGDATPEAGEHTWEILHDVLGYDDAKATAVIEAGVT